MDIPIPNATVEIYKNEQLVDSKQTDENGRAIFTIPADVYKIVAKKEGYTKHEQVEEIYNDLTKKIYLKKCMYPSGIDPYIEPIFKDRWGMVIDFKSVPEIKFCNKRYIEGASVENSVLRLEHGKIDWSNPFAMYISHVPIARLAIALRLIDVNYNDYITIVYISSYVAARELFIDYNGEIKRLCVVSYVGGAEGYGEQQEVCIEYDGDWIAIVFDAVTDTVYFYNKDMEVINSGNIDLSDLRNGNKYAIEFAADQITENGNVIGYIDLLIDWIAIKDIIPSGYELVVDLSPQPVLADNLNRESLVMLDARTDIDISDICNENYKNMEIDDGVLKTDNVDEDHVCLISDTTRCVPEILLAIKYNIFESKQSVTIGDIYLRYRKQLQEVYIKSIPNNVNDIEIESYNGSFKVTNVNNKFIGIFISLGRKVICIFKSNGYLVACVDAEGIERQTIRCELMLSIGVPTPRAVENVRAETSIDYIAYKGFEQYL